MPDHTTRVRRAGGRYRTGADAIECIERPITQTEAAAEAAKQAKPSKPAKPAPIRATGAESKSVADDDADQAPDRSPGQARPSGTTRKEEAD